MTEYPTPIFFSFFGYDAGMDNNDADAEIVKEKSTEGETKKTGVIQEEEKKNITTGEIVVNRHFKFNSFTPVKTRIFHGERCGSLSRKGQRRGHRGSRCAFFLQLSH